MMRDWIWTLSLVACATDVEPAWRPRGRDSGGEPSATMPVDASVPALDASPETDASIPTLDASVRALPKKSFLTSPVCLFRGVSYPEV
jgi:hypothetical protein